MKKEDIKKILDQHYNWLTSKDGKCANLSDADLRYADLSDADLTGANLRDANLRYADLTGANLRDANLRYADLRYANLSGADLTGANLRDADLRYANLSDADLTGANLSDADLTGANLRDANLSGADLRGANLTGADLRGADLTGANLPDFQIVPQEGSFIGYKKLSGGIVAKLLIPEHAKRTSTLIGRKCRASCVEVLSGSGMSPTHNTKLLYKPGLVVKADHYDDSIKVECAPGIHFFMTEKEAREW